MFEQATPCREARGGFCTSPPKSRLFGKRQSPRLAPGAYCLSMISCFYFVSLVGYRAEERTLLDSVSSSEDVS